MPLCEIAKEIDSVIRELNHKSIKIQETFEMKLRSQRHLKMSIRLLDNSSIKHLEPKNMPRPTVKIVAHRRLLQKRGHVSKRQHRDVYLNIQHRLLYLPRNSGHPVADYLYSSL